MRAYAADRFGELSELRLQDVPKPAPKPGELLVEIRAAAVNPADFKVLGHRGGGSFLHASTFPLILGYDFSGVVAEVGASVGAGPPPHAVGDAVYGFIPYARSTRGGTYAEFVCAGQAAVGPKARTVSHEQAAAAATAAITALQALRDKGRLAAGQRVLVNGASGGVGGYAVQIAKAMGATVSATASAAKTQHCAAAGADRVYDYRATPLAAIDETFDVVFDVASTSSFGACARLLAPGGTYVNTLPGPGLVLGLLRSWVTSKRCRSIMVKPVAADFAQITAWFDAGKLVPQLDSTYPFAELPQALARYQAGTHAGKIAITI